MLAVIVMVTKRWTNTCTGPDSKVYKKVEKVEKGSSKAKAKAKMRV